MRSADPGWAKAKLSEKLDALDQQLETGALDLLQERRILVEMRGAVMAHREWLEDRITSNPELKTYYEGQKRLHALYGGSEQAHQQMLVAAEASQSAHDEYKPLHEELIEAKRQLNRAVSLEDQSPAALTYWKRRNEDGSGELGPDLPDLLADAQRVAAGGASTIVARSPKQNQKGGEEE